MARSSKKTLTAVEKYNVSAFEEKLIGRRYIRFSLVLLLAAFYINFIFLLGGNFFFILDIEITTARIIPINVFLVSGITLLSSLGFFHLRIARDRENKALELLE